MKWKEFWRHPPAPEPPTQHRITQESIEFFDLIKPPRKFHLVGGRYGLLVDGKFERSSGLLLNHVGLIHESLIPVSRIFNGPGYQVLELTKGEYEITMMGSITFSARIAVIHG